MRRVDSAPTITSVSSTQVSGTPGSNCAIEVLPDANGEGGIYEGTSTTDAASNWTLNKPVGFQGQNVTAAATDADGNTSEFSTPVSVS